MEDEELRMRCVDIASRRGSTASVTGVITDAAKIEAHIRYGRLKDENGFINIGPECFANDDATVISFKGENYYRACNKFVHQDSEGTRSHCVKRVGHPAALCEDFDGNHRQNLPSEE